MKNRLLTFLSAIAVMLAFATLTASAQDKSGCKTGDSTKTTVCIKKDTTACVHKADKTCCKQALVCPVSGQPANKEIFSVYKGQKVYFCCNNCKAAFDKDPEKYAAKIHQCTGACKKQNKASCKMKKGNETGKDMEKPAQK
jgi:YHS domain-containing protein